MKPRKPKEEDGGSFTIIDPIKFDCPWCRLGCTFGADADDQDCDRLLHLAPPCKRFLELAPEDFVSAAVDEYKRLGVRLGSN